MHAIVDDLLLRLRLWRPSESVEIREVAFVQERVDRGHAIFTTDKLVQRALVTEARASVNLKYGPQMEVENFARLILFSNHTYVQEQSETEGR
jgi:hypothetical protein